MNRKMNASGEYSRLNTAFIAVFVGAVILLNFIVYALAVKFEWYIYAEESYEHTIGTASDVLFSENEQKDVEIIFCMEQDELSSDVIYDLVWQTALQLEQKHDFVTVSNVNIYLQPSKVAKYKYTTHEDGSKTRNVISTSSVIFVCGEEFRVETLSSFFVLDSEGRVQSYNGEEFMLSCIKWVQTDDHPIAYFTHTHGENFTGLMAFYNILTACGYELRTIDLASEKLDERASLVIISNPLYDIEKAAEGSGIVSDAEQLDAFLSRGGTLFVSIDPYIKSPLTQLRAYLSSWGMDTNPSIITDTENSITHDGYTLVAKYAQNGLGREIADDVAKYNTSQTILRDASPITLTQKDGVQTSEIVSSYPSAKSYYGGSLYSDGGNFTLLAVSERDEGRGGRVILSSGAYLLANDVLNSSVYSNRELILSLLEHSDAPYAVKGASVLPISSTMLEGLTASAARAYAVVLIGVIPALVALFGILYLARRKNR